MDFLQFNTLLSETFKYNNIQPPSPEISEQFFSLTNLLVETNKSMNLTSITSISEIILKHYADSLTISTMIPQEANVLDVGCGAGFPTLPLAIYRPDITIVPLDSTAKKIDYIKHVIDELGLYNVKPIVARAEELAHESEYREKFSIVTARAVANMRVLTELCMPFVKKNGIFIAMKGQNAEEELDSARNAIELCGGEISTVSIISLCRTDSKDKDTRQILGIAKTKPTPSKYPRQYAKISKSPL